MASRAVAYAAALLAVGTGAILFACGERATPLETLPQTDTGVTAAREYAKIYHADKKRIPHRLATNPGTPWGDFVGSKACESCHQKEYDDWRASLHSRTLYDVAPETVFGTFPGNLRYETPGYAFFVRPFRERGKFFMEVTLNPDPDAEKDNYGAGVPPHPVGVWELLYAFGNRRHQPFVARDETGRYWAMPYYWNDVTKSWMLAGWRPYVESCAHCHVTGIKSLDHKEPGSIALPMTQPVRWSPPPTQEGWAEGAVGCEICHGPSKPHVDLALKLGAEAFKKRLADGGSSLIYCPSRDTPEMRMKQCDSCHNFNSESPVTWVPGPNGYDHTMGYAPIHPPGGQFYDDGTDMSPCTVGRVFRDSKMGRSGKVECKDCHDSHGNESFGSLVKPLAKNELCLTCHSDKFGTTEQLVAHTHHKADGIGSSCVECHMPRDKRFTNGVHVMSAQIPSHVISIPTGEQRKGGPEPSCNTCHTDRDALWTWKKIRELWAKPAAGK